jgi:hypothetical protein
VSGARAFWYKRHVAELWSDLSPLSRDAVALHLLLSDLAFLRGSLPEDEAELRRVAGVSEELWRSWPEIRDLWPVTNPRPRVHRARPVGAPSAPLSRLNPALGGAFSHASEACTVNQKRAQKAARIRWKAPRRGDAPSIPPGDAPSNASSMLGAMQKERKKDRKKEKERARSRAVGFSSTERKKSPPERALDTHRDPRSPNAPEWVRLRQAKLDRGEPLSTARPDSGIPEDHAFTAWCNGYDWLPPDVDPTGSAS